MYKVEIKESSKELTKRERIRLKDTSEAAGLDDLSMNSDLVISPVGYAVLGVHNDAADDPDYEQYLIWDNEDNCYVTGSRSFWESFLNIWEEMTDEGFEPFEIRVIRKESKNYKGKEFLKAVLI